jgi:hypothetical protein
MSFYPIEGVGSNVGEAAGGWQSQKSEGQTAQSTEHRAERKRRGKDDLASGVGP